MEAVDKLQRLYQQELAKGPFPSLDCAEAHITGKLHGELVMYLADIAGLASRGKGGLTSLPESEKAAFRRLATKSLFERHPVLRTRIAPASTPRLYALLDSTERARQIILEALSQ